MRSCQEPLAPVFTLGRLDSALAQLRGDLTQPAFLAHARAQAEPGHDGLRSVALGAYLVARAVERLLLVPVSDEGIVWQMASTARYVEDLPQDDAEVSHLQGIVRALSLDRPEAMPALRAPLLGYASWLECEGRLDLALEALRLAARTWVGEIPAADFTQLALAVARVNRQLGRLDLSADAYAAGADAALLAADRAGAARAHLGALAVRRLKGELGGLDEQLLAMLRQAETDAALADLAPLMHAERGALDALLGRVAQAARSLLAAARAASGSPEQTQIMEGLAQVLVAAGALEPARELLEHVADVAPERVTRVRAQLELMEIASAQDDRLAFERLRAGMRPPAPVLAPPLRVEFLYHAGLGLFRFGQHARATACWQEAVTLAEAQGLTGMVRLLGRLLDSIDHCRGREVERPAAPLLDVHALESDVHALVQSAGA